MIVNKNRLLLQAIALVPNVLPYLNPRAKFLYHGFVTMMDVQGPNKEYAHWHMDDKSEPIHFAYKTLDYFLAAILGLVRGLYSGNLGGNFVDVMANLISGQLTQAYQQAYEDEGFTGFFLPDYLQSGLEGMILNQYTFVDQFFRDIVDARVDGTSIDPLLARARLWANRWDEAYQSAVTAIALENGGRMMWMEGDTQEKCSTCVSLDGIVMFAKEWETLGLHPGGGPNGKLACSGWNCRCRLVPTEQRRSPDAYGRVEEILL